MNNISFTSSIKKDLNIFETYIIIHYYGNYY
jgi:hypothetical protein